MLKTLRCPSDLRIATFWLKWAKSLKLNSPAFNHNSLCDLLQLVLNYVVSFRICVSPQVFRGNTQLTPICPARSLCLAAVYYIKRLLIKLIWYNTQLTPICPARFLCLAAVYYIKRLLIKLIWYNTQLTPICPARSPCLAAVYYIKRLLIKLIWSNTRNNIYVKIKAFFRIKFHISENFRFINLHRIINFCPITPVRLFNTVPKYRDVACLTRMGGTHHLRAET